jgi:anti-sigma regulatory factor (Ser/Thr protein kinase)
VSRDVRTPGRAAPTGPPLEIAAETVPASVARLRRFAVDACATAAPDVDRHTVALLVSEVVTNALVHGSGQVRLRVLPLEVGVRIEVFDGSSVLPTRRRATELDEGGRGIALVEALAVAWGSQAAAGGKCVWFEVAPA